MLPPVFGAETLAKAASTSASASTNPPGQGHVPPFPNPDDSDVEVHKSNGPSCHPRASHHHQHLQSLAKDQTMKGQAQAMTVEYWQRPSLWSSWYLEIIKIVENVREAASRSQLPAFNSPVEWSLPNRQPNNIVNKPWFLIPKLAACICAYVCLCPQAPVLSRPDGKTNWGACSKLQTYLGWASLASLTWSIERVLLVGCTTAFCRFGPETKP